VQTTEDTLPSPYLQAVGIKKRFGHVEALQDANVAVRLGECMALVGDNGAGKSTLVKVLSGVLRPDAGDILVDGTRVLLDSPLTARRCGIETVYQDLALAADLTAAGNLFLGREVRRRGLLGWLGVLDNEAMNTQALALMQKFKIKVKDARARVSDLSGGQRQGVAVARAAAWAARIIILDEPTAALGVEQSRAVRALVHSVKDSGCGVVLISHNMTEVLELADRIQVLRFGRGVAHFMKGEATIESIVTAMTTGGDDGVATSVGTGATAAERLGGISIGDEA